MRKVSGDNFAKGMALLLSVSMMMGVTGCGETVTEKEEIASAEENSSEETDSAEDNSSEEIVESRASITDFDEFVNGEWKKQKEQENNGSAAFLWDEQAQADEKVRYKKKMKTGRFIMPVFSSWMHGLCTNTMRFM